MAEAEDAVESSVEAVAEVAEQVAQHPALQLGARIGYAVSGLLHLLMGGLALKLATGDRSANPDQSGALATLAGTPLGWLLLGAASASLGLLGLWQLAQVVRRRPVGSRAKAAAKAALYGVMAFGAADVIAGSRESSAEDTADLTALLLSWPLGQLLVGAVGGAIGGVAVFHLVKGVRRGFLKDLCEHPSTLIVALAATGYVAKGVALAIVGWLFVQAAWLHDPGRSTGLDGALTLLLTGPAGPALVALVGLGFVAYGIYSAARARFART